MKKISKQERKASSKSTIRAKTNLRAFKAIDLAVAQELGVENDHDYNSGNNSYRDAIVSTLFFGIRCVISTKGISALFRMCLLHLLSMSNYTVPYSWASSNGGFSKLVGIFVAICRSAATDKYGMEKAIFLLKKSTNLVRKFLKFYTILCTFDRGSLALKIFHSLGEKQSLKVINAWIIATGLHLDCCMVQFLKHCLRSIINGEDLGRHFWDLINDAIAVFDQAVVKNPFVKMLDRSRSEIYHLRDVPEFDRTDLKLQLKRTKRAKLHYKMVVANLSDKLQLIRKSTKGVLTTKKIN